jgi:hypothetical protein
VPIMGDIYANGTRNLIWLGELPDSNRASVWFDVDEHIPETEHSSLCLCNQGDVGTNGQTVRSIITAPLISLAIPALMRLAAVRECNDFRVCRIFGSPLEVLAFQHFADHFTSNSWFQRIWVIQEVVRAPQSTCLIANVGFPFQALQTACAVSFKHFKNECCADLKLRIIIMQMSLLMHTSVNLYNAAKRLRHKQTMDIFLIRLELPGRKASLDVDLVYGVLGLTTKTLGITPDYNLPADVIFTNLSKTYIQSLSLRSSFWIFAFAPLRNRYPNLPSWVIDWTIFDNMSEREALYMRYTVQILNNRFLGSRDEHYPRTLPKSEPVVFDEGQMLSRASYIDSIADTSDVAVEEPSPHARVVRDWRSLIVSRHAPGDWYHVPEIFNNDPVIEWALAWMRMLCGGVISRPVVGVGLMTTEDEERVLTDALLDRHNLCLLRRSALHDGPEEHGVPTFHPAMQHPVVYSSFCKMSRSLLHDKRLFLTNGSLIGFANYMIELGDEIWLADGLAVLLLLQPVKQPQEASKVSSSQDASDARKKYRVISTCYLEGCMSGRREGATVPVEELWIIRYTSRLLQAAKTADAAVRE